MNPLKFAAGAGVPTNPYVWDIAAIGSNPALAWDVSKCVWVKSFSVSAQETTPTGIFFKPDGTKMYIIGSSGDDVNEYSLSTPWLVSTASFVQVFSVSAQDTSPQALFFKPDGTKMYMLGGTGDDVNEYDLSSAWDISTASYLQNFSVATQEINPTGLFFKPDGTKMYVCGTSGDDVNEYDLGTAWNISTASFVQTFSVSAQDTSPTGVFFRSDGVRMYVIGAANHKVYEYNLSTAWNVSTASFSRDVLMLNTQTYTDVFIRPDGLGMYVIDSTGQRVLTFLFVNSFSVSGQETGPSGLTFKPDGSQMYIVGSGGDEVNEYSLSAWNLSSSSFVQLFSVAAQETVPQGLFFKPDGTKMYVVGSLGDDVNEYTLSSAWDISTASFVQVFSVAAQEVNPNGVFFKSDGTKMYIIGSTGDDINEYSLSSAWDISTASYVQNFSVASQTAVPEDLYISPDGENLYIVNRTDIDQYSLGTPWDISTATFQKNYGFADFVGADGISFRPNGSIVYIVDSTKDAIYEFYLNGKG